MGVTQADQGRKSSTSKKEKKEEQKEKKKMDSVIGDLRNRAGERLKCSGRRTGKREEVGGGGPLGGGRVKWGKY